MARPKTVLFLLVLGCPLNSDMHKQFSPSRREVRGLESAQVPRTQWTGAVCAFGQSLSCCYGWKNLSGICQPQCSKPCKHGICTGPNRCTCFTGFKGKYCDTDINECGLIPRLCSQRCMNTHGAYRCYCRYGYQMSPDGKTCSKTSSCSQAWCQYSCRQLVNGGARCLCPRGLQLASDDRTCEDINECQKRMVTCPQSKICKNTFGSYLCVCMDGFVIGNEDENIKCRDKDECLLGDHGCSRHGLCINTYGSYTCRCQENFRGDGFVCKDQQMPHKLRASLFRYRMLKRKKILRDP